MVLALRAEKGIQPFDDYGPPLREKRLVRLDLE